MLDDDLTDLLDSVLTPGGAKLEPGEEYRTPALDVLRYYRRDVRLHWVPIIGSALSLVAVVRQPQDIGIAGDGYRTLMARIARAASNRFPPIRAWAGLSLGLTAVVLTPEPIGPDDDSLLAKAMEDLPRHRVVPLGLLRVNLGQEACAFALRTGPDGLFTEPEALADALAEKLRRFAPRLEI